MNDQSNTSKLTHAANIALIVGAVLAMFWRVLFLGETLIDLRTLENQLPWGYSAGDTDYPYNRRDLTDMYITREYFVVDAYRDGEAPMWNPYTMAGHPIYADGVTRTLSPFLLFYTFLDVPLGYSVARITELMLAAIFMYLFLVAIGAGSRGGLFGSLIFGFSSHSMLHLAGLGWWGGLMWLPLIALFVDRAIKRDSNKSAAIAGVFLAIQFFCGYQANQIYYVATIGFYYVFHAASRFRADRDLRAVRRRAKQLAITLFTGFALAAIQWVPTMELLRHSNRRVVPTEIGYIYLPPWYIATLIFPDLFGSAYDVRALRLFTAINVSHDHILYIGIAALAAISFCIYSARSSSGELAARIRFFGLLGLSALIIMVAAPLYVHVTRFIPVLQTIRVIVRAGVIFLFAASVLAGFGAKLLIEADACLLSRFYRVARSFFVIVASVVAVTVVAGYAFRTAFIEDQSARGATAFVKRALTLLFDQFAPPAPGILIPLFLVMMVLLLLRLKGRDSISAPKAFAALVVLLVADLCWNAIGYNPSFEAAKVFQPTNITEMLRMLPPGRVLVAPASLESNRSLDGLGGEKKIIAPPNTLLPYQIPVVTGKDQLYPRWYRDYCTLIEPQPNLSHVVFDRVHSPFLDLLNVRYVLTHADSPAPPDSKLLQRDEGVAVYENRQAMARAFLVHRIVPVDDAITALAVMAREGFDPRTTAVIEGAEPVSQQLEQGSAGETTAITIDARNRVDVDVAASTPAYLILSDTYYPGWNAYVDGIPANIYRANGSMRAVKVPAGRHVVSFVFAPRSLRISFYVSVGALVVLIVAFALFTARSDPQSLDRENRLRFTKR